jgi:NADH-quinone oxidoreductase subunit E
VIQVCCTLPCALAGAMDVLGLLEQKLGVAAGETTADGRFTLLKAECLAACDEAPLVQIDDGYYGKLTPEKLDALLEKFL